MSSFFRIAASAACIFLSAQRAGAQATHACAAQIDRKNLVACALEASLSVRGEQASLLATQGRRTAASVLLPSNPVLALSGARRTAAGGTQTALNWAAELSQELEVGGQRAARSRAADAELAAQKQRVLLSKRDTAAAAWTAYFEALAAKREQALASELLRASQRMSAVARGKAERGLVATVDADVVEAATVRVLQAKLRAARKWATATAELTALLGRDASQPVTVVEGELSPLAGESPSAAAKTSDRPETRLLSQEQKALSARADTLRRARVPNPTLSVFAQNDGFDERVYGLGIAIPIPLPSPVGRTNAGEIAELEALGQRVQIERARIERALGLEVASAAAELRAHREAVAALTPQMIGRAERSLSDLSDAVDTGRLSVRDALITEQALIELLQTNLSEQLELCLASVRLARALGRPLEEGAQ